MSYAVDAEVDCHTISSPAVAAPDASAADTAVASVASFASVSAVVADAVRRSDALSPTALASSSIP